MSLTARGARWFTRVMWIGIVANLALALPTLVAPAHAGVQPACRRRSAAVAPVRGACCSFS